MTDSTETLSDEFLHVRSIVMGGLLDLDGFVPRWRLEERATAITRALMSREVRGAVAKGEIRSGGFADRPDPSEDDERIK